MSDSTDDRDDTDDCNSTVECPASDSHYKGCPVLSHPKGVGIGWPET